LADDREAPNADRRKFLRGAGGIALTAASQVLLPASIARALAIPADRETRTIRDVRHVVILMMENRSFNHYFGTLRGARGFGDRHPIPLPNGKTVWHQSDGANELVPFHLDTKNTNALRVPVTPHSFDNAQAAWGQGRLSEWPKHKTGFSMGYYRRDDIPFQFALAEAFTICDAYHCSVTTGTDPNRIAFWSGSNFDPAARAGGENSTPDNSEPDNLRCWIEGALPEPGYTYAGNALTWPTIPDVLEQAGISWRFYQDPNNNWTGAMHGCLAFKSFREAKPGSPLYEKGMRHWSLDAFAEDVRTGRLPQVSWILPPMLWSEHPLPSSPAQGAEFVSRVLDALTANPETWSRTAFLITFDENDGQFDHVPPPAPPSYNLDGSLAGKSTLDLAGHYFHDPERKHIAEHDTLSGNVRPWGLGPRVPAYIVSPWSKGGWVCSETFDHGSIGQFLEKRFDITIPAISPWSRAIAGDLTSAFDFSGMGDAEIPHLPDASGSSIALLEAAQRPTLTVPTAVSLPLQETGTRPSRALPYVLHVEPQLDERRHLSLLFRNGGTKAAVFHVYDRQRLDLLPRRYTVERGKLLTDTWAPSLGGWDLFVLGPGGFLRTFSGQLRGDTEPVDVDLHYLPAVRSVELTARNVGRHDVTLAIEANAYRTDGPWALDLPGGKRAQRRFTLADSGNWYDFTVRGDGFERRFAGRLETGRPSTSDPAIGVSPPGAV
jgi:phospholipase C